MKQSCFNPNINNQNDASCIQILKKNFGRMNLHQLKKNLLLIFFLFIIPQAYGQVEKFEAIYIYSISRYFEWPAEMKNGNFVIGVLGNSDIIKELKGIAETKTILGQKIEIATFSNTAAITKCHVLFIAPSQSINIATASISSGSSNALIFSNHNDGIVRGSAINFIFLDNKLKFELKASNATAKGLKVSPELDKLASKVL